MVQINLETTIASLFNHAVLLLLYLGLNLLSSEFLKHFGCFDFPTYTHWTLLPTARCALHLYDPIFVFRLLFSLDRTQLILYNNCGTRKTLEIESTLICVENQILANIMILR